MLLRYLLTSSGPLSRMEFQVGGFVRSRLEVEHPDLQLIFLPCIFTAEGGLVFSHGFEVTIKLADIVSRVRLNLLYHTRLN
jgi:hypothetical protein